MALASAGAPVRVVLGRRYVYVEDPNGVTVHRIKRSEWERMREEARLRTLSKILGYEVRSYVVERRA